jgi:alpha-tubulin suppressor-like RCC1 family protein
VRPSRFVLSLAVLAPTLLFGCTALLGDFTSTGSEDAGADVASDMAVQQPDGQGSMSDGPRGGEAAPDGGVDAPPPTITALAAGFSSCALWSDGHVDCWGYNVGGALGIGDAGLGTQNPPTRVVGLNDATQLASSLITCALRATGQVVCWGQNDQGSLGDGQDAATPLALTPVPVALIGDAAQLSVGIQESCVVRKNGQVACWGPLATTSDGGVSPVPVPVLGINTATQVAVGGDHVCALLSDGTVSCWGARTTTGRPDSRRTAATRTTCQRPRWSRASPACHASRRATPTRARSLRPGWCTAGGAATTGSSACRRRDRSRRPRSSSRACRTSSIS